MTSRAHVIQKNPSTEISPSPSMNQWMNKGWCPHRTKNDLSRKRNEERTHGNNMAKLSKPHGKRKMPTRKADNDPL